jgi:hypothetical protein
LALVVAILVDVAVAFSVFPGYLKDTSSNNPRLSSSKSLPIRDEIPPLLGVLDPYPLH